MVLNDTDIRVIGQSGWITPYDPTRVQPASVDLTLGNKFKLWLVPEYFGHHWLRQVVDLNDVANSTKGLMNEFDLNDDQTFMLEPRAFCLATTHEAIYIPRNLVGRVEGKSSLGRLGLVCHATAGFIDPGFRGTITLELFNMNPNPMVIRPGRAICQLSYMQLTDVPEREYGHADLNSHYQNQETTTESRYEG